MPTIRLAVQTNRSGQVAINTPRGLLNLQFPQLRCLLRLPNMVFPKDCVIDTGAPLVWFPESIWQSFRPGIDYEDLTLAPGATLPPGRIGSWQFTYHMVRFLTPLTIMDYTTAVERPDVIAAFATGNPPAYQASKAPPPIVIGLWGGVLEDSRLAIDRSPNGTVTGELEYP